MNIRRPHILRAAAVTAACLAALCCNACRKTLTYDCLLYTSPSPRDTR